MLALIRKPSSNVVKIDKDKSYTFIKVFLFEFLGKFQHLYKFLVMSPIALLVTRVVRRGNHLGVVIHHTLAVVSLLMSLLTVSIDPLLTLLDIDGVHNLLAGLLRDLASVLVGVLVALLLLLVMTTGSTGISLLSRLSRTLVVPSMTSITSVTSMTFMTFMTSLTSMTIVLMVNINNLRVSSNNVRIVVDLLMLFLAVSDYKIFALLSVSDIHHNIIVNIALLVVLLFGDFVALVVLLVMAVRTTVVSMAISRISSAVHKSGGQEDD